MGLGTPSLPSEAAEDGDRERSISTILRLTLGVEFPLLEVFKMGTGRGEDAAGMLEGFGLVAVGVRGRVVVVVGAKVTMAGMVFSFRKRVIRFSNAMPLGSS